MAINEAIVQTLMAEVKTLMMGSRQITLSVYRQLDEVPPEQCLVFGRTNLDFNYEDGYWVIGSDLINGALVKSNWAKVPFFHDDNEKRADQEYMGIFNGTGFKHEIARIMNDVSQTKKFIERRFDPTTKSRKISRQKWYELPLIVFAGLR